MDRMRNLIWRWWRRLRGLPVIRGRSITMRVPREELLGALVGYCRFTEAGPAYRPPKLAPEIWDAIEPSMRPAVALALQQGWLHPRNFEASVPAIEASALPDRFPAGE